MRCDVWWKMHQAVPRPAAAMKYHIHIHIFIAGCEQKSWGEAMSGSSTLFCEKKTPRGRIPLKWLSYEIAQQIHCCRYISFLYVYWFCKIFGDIQHEVDWIQQISINTHFFTLMFFTMGTHLTDLPLVRKISYLSLTFLWEIVSYLTSEKHSFKPKWRRHFINSPVWDAMYGWRCIGRYSASSCYEVSHLHTYLHRELWTEKLRWSNVRLKHSFLWKKAKE